MTSFDCPICGELSLPFPIEHLIFEHSDIGFANWLESECPGCREIVDVAEEFQHLDSCLPLRVWIANRVLLATASG